MADARFTFFNTPIGLCGIAWRGIAWRGIAWRGEAEPAVSHFQLPEASDAMTRERLARKVGGTEITSPPDAIVKLIDRVGAHLRGNLDHFTDVPLDLDGVIDFNRAVYDFSRRIPPGATRTYGEVAAGIGKPGTAQAVGKALGQNPIPLIVPCHRILAAGGRPGGFSAHGGTATKSRLLQIEGAVLF